MLEAGVVPTIIRMNKHAMAAVHGSLWGNAVQKRLMCRFVSFGKDLHVRAADPSEHGGLTISALFVGRYIFNFMNLQNDIKRERMM